MSMLWWVPGGSAVFFPCHHPAPADTIRVKMTDERPNVLGALECLLFMADRPLAPGELAELLDVAPPAVRQLLEALQGRYLGLQIIEVAGGFELATKTEFAAVVGRLHQPPKFRLSP
ncbi:MAG TPA: SMC-Scp complex subunit ScpB, partial [Armatimonadota bacterium]|nr:SMC-Scp complex subunit ScpB [Armatimonadota bacterium]